MPNDMSLFEVFKKRRSVRAFKSQKIKRDVITELLWAVQSSPTAGNLQAYHIYLAESHEKIRALGKASYNQSCVFEAPAVLVFTADQKQSSKEYGERGKNLYCIQDATIAATFAHLAAVALGLGSVMVGAFNTGEVSRIIGAPNTQIPILMLSLGYPDENPAPTGRRPLEEMITFI